MKDTACWETPNGNYVEVETRDLIFEEGSERTGGMKKVEPLVFLISEKTATIMLFSPDPNS